MKYFYFLFFIIFLLSIKKIISDNDIYRICEDGYYGLNCSQRCSCDQWSSNNTCSKNEGRCLKCRFGHFGKNCEDICYPKCKTNLCCAIKFSEFKNSKISLTSNLSILKVYINKIELNISIDYNVGYPLTIFNKAITEKDLPSKLKDDDNVVYNYTNYNVSGKEYLNNTIAIKTEDFILKVPIVLDEEKKDNLNGINGVIGLGFSNSINMALFKDKAISLNIASYKLENNEISILFGDLFEKEKKYISKLSFCEALFDYKSKDLSISTMKCGVEGMKSQDSEDALELEETEIHFSLDREESSFILKNNENYKNYITNLYFNNKNYQEIRINDTIFYCFKKDEKNILTNFGFVINKYYYPKMVNEYFIDDEHCPSNYQKFLIGFDVNNKSEIIFGKDFFKNTQITIDNEERKIYFYVNDAEYFSGELSPSFKFKPVPPLTPFQISFLIMSSVFVLNIISFLIYFYFKRKKEKIS